MPPVSRRSALSVIAALGLFAAACGSGATEPLAAQAAAAPVPVPSVTAEPSPPPPTATPEPTPSPAYTAAPGALRVPVPLPAGEPGQIIDTETLTIPGAVGQRILYRSTSAQGDPVAVSGFVAIPSGDPPADGWPLVAWAHGTVGLGDRCAPSLHAETDPLALALVGFGYAVVATDYEGLGTPGLHPYVVGASEAHSVLDSVRAVAELELPVTNQWVAFGHSQGGHAAMFTGQLQPTYAPELDLIGVIAGAPPSQMNTLGEALIGSEFQGYLVMTAAGLVAADPSLDLADVFTDEAIELIDVVESGCTEEIFEAYNPLVYDDVARVDDPFTLPDWRAAIEANDTNLRPVEVPLMIIHGGDDEQIPVDTSEVLLAQLCRFETQGPTIRKVYEGQTHAGVLTTLAAVPDLLAWLAGRFAGEAAPDDCLGTR